MKDKKLRRFLKIIPLMLLLFGLMYFNLNAAKKDNGSVELSVSALSVSAKAFNAEDCFDECDTQTDHYIELSNERARDAMWDCSFGHLGETAIPEALQGLLPSVSDMLSMGPIVGWFEDMIGLYGYVFENLDYIYGCTGFVDDIRENEYDLLMDQGMDCYMDCY